MILKPLGRPELPATWPGLEKAMKYQQISMKINDIEAPGRPELPPTWPGLEKAMKYQQISMKINDIEAPGPPEASSDLARARKSNDISTNINENL